MTKCPKCESPLQKVDDNGKVARYVCPHCGARVMAPLKGSG